MGAPPSYREVLVVKIGRVCFDVDAEGWDSATPELRDRVFDLESQAAFLELDKFLEREKAELAGEPRVDGPRAITVAEVDPEGEMGLPPDRVLFYRWTVTFTGYEKCGGVRWVTRGRQKP